MLAKCLKDTYGTPQTGLFLRDQEYDIDPHDPWAIHFDLNGEDRKIAIAEHRKRIKAANDNRKKALANKESGDEFGDIAEDETSLSDTPIAPVADAPTPLVQEEKKFACGYCGKEMKSEVGLRIHKSQKHRKKQGFKSKSPSAVNQEPVAEAPVSEATA